LKLCLPSERNTKRFERKRIGFGDATVSMVMATATEARAIVASTVGFANVVLEGADGIVPPPPPQAATTAAHTKMVV